jgi:hypothetical protein
MYLPTQTTPHNSDQSAHSSHLQRETGLCEPREKRQAAVLAKFNLPRLHQARGRGYRAQEADRLAYLSAHIWDDLECQRGKSQSHSGTSASRESPSHDGHVRSGCEQREARGAEQGGQTAFARSGEKAGVSGRLWTRGKTSRILEVVYFVGVPDGI